MYYVKELDSYKEPDSEHEKYTDACEAAKRYSMLIGVCAIFKDDNDEPEDIYFNGRCYSSE